MLRRKEIIKYVFIVIAIKIVGFSLFFMYKVENVEVKKEIKILAINPMQTINAPKKEKLSLQEKKEQKNNQMKWRLEHMMADIYESSCEVYDKTKNKKMNLTALKKHLDSFGSIDVFVATYYEQTLYGSNDYTDINARTVVLEEIQKVRRSGSGFIISTIDIKGTTRYILVKDLKYLNLYIGINIIE